MNEDLVFIVKHPVEFIMILFLVFLGIHYYNKNQLDDLTKVYAEITATTGGFTTSQYNDFIEDLKDIGHAEEETIITISATDPDGKDISSKAINVTPPSDAGYSQSPTYCPRGTKITLKVISKKKAVLNSIFKFINSTTDISLGTSKRIYMSERVE